jgi:hypothetical protein
MKKLRIAIAVHIPTHGRRSVGRPGCPRRCLRVGRRREFILDNLVIHKAEVEALGTEADPSALAGTKAE